jgi:hypothetical protein
MKSVSFARLRFFVTVNGNAVSAAKGFEFFPGLLGAPAVKVGETPVFQRGLDKSPRLLVKGANHETSA